MAVIKLADKSNYIQVTPDEALQLALDSEFNKTHVFILLIDENNELTQSYQGGGLLYSKILWYLEQHKLAMLEGREE